jgi:hypothetical protein
MNRSVVSRKNSASFLALARDISRRPETISDIIPREHPRTSPVQSVSSLAAQEEMIGSRGVLTSRSRSKAGLKPEKDRVGPRPCDFRHAFAVQRLSRWYWQGVDLYAKLPGLSASGNWGPVEVVVDGVYWIPRRHSKQKGNPRPIQSDASLVPLLVW